MRYFSGVAGLLLVSIAFARGHQPQDVVADTPDQHWIFEAMSDLVKRGILTHLPTNLARPPGRYEVAAATAVAFSRFHDLVRDLSRSNEILAHASESASGRSLGDDLKFAKQITPEVSAELRKLVTFFGPELARMDQEPKRMAGQLRRDVAMIASFRLAKPGEAKKQFNDVPDGHWAADAVRNLRSLGVLRGYEDATLRG